jgi:enamine deaminase RidA (YjgF/YER057c/UK114 family)
VKVGDTIYVSGQVDHDEAGKSFIPAPWNTKCARLTPTSKESSPISALRWTVIVDEILFVLDMDSAMKARGRLKDEVFGQAILPAATIVQI